MIGDISHDLNQLNQMENSQGVFNDTENFKLELPLQIIRFSFVITDIPDHGLHFISRGSGSRLEIYQNFIGEFYID